MVHEVTLREQQVAAVRGQVVQQVVVLRQRGQQAARGRRVRARHARAQPRRRPPRAVLAAAAAAAFAATWDCITLPLPFHCYYYFVYQKKDWESKMVAYCEVTTPFRRNYTGSTIEHSVTLVVII